MTTWFDKMAYAMRQRETALNGVARWQEKLKNAEDVIAKLGAEAPAATGPTDPTTALGYAPAAAAPTQEPANEPAPAAEELPAA